MGIIQEVNEKSVLRFAYVRTATSKALGLAVPATVLALTDEVIE
jgi:hypothetical protein